MRRKLKNDEAVSFKAVSFFVQHIGYFYQYFVFIGLHIFAKCNQNPDSHQHDFANIME